MNKLKIALLGSIPKGDEERRDWIDWKTQYIEKIRIAIPQAQFLHGDLICDSVGPELVVGHDLWLIKNADIVIVHALSKIGAGTAQEMVLAKSFQKPLIAIIPKNTHHRRSGVIFHGRPIGDWIHPFLVVASDYVAENIEEAIVWIQAFSKKPTPTKTLAVYYNTIASFERELPDIVKSYRKNGW